MTEPKGVTVVEVDTMPVYDPGHGWYWGHTRAVFWIDLRDRTCGIRQEYANDGLLTDVYHGHIRTYWLECHPDENEARRLLEESPLLQEICDGYTRNHQWGVLSDEAESAYSALVIGLDELAPYYEWWAVRDWIADMLESEITAGTTDEQVAEYGRQWSLGGEQDGFYVILGDGAEERVRELIHERRAYLRAVDEE